MYIVSPSVCPLPKAAAAQELAKSILNCKDQMQADCGVLMVRAAQWHSVCFLAQRGADTGLANADGLDYLCLKPIS